MILLGLECRVRFEVEATNYDNTLYVLPRYGEVMDRIMSYIDYSKDACIRVLELGCGTGTLTQRILSCFPKAIVYAVDFSISMLEVAQNKIGKNPRVHFIEKNIFEIDENELPYFDIVVSTFVLHNYEEPNLYQEIFAKSINLLSAGGKLIYGDLVQCANTVQKSERRMQVQLMQHNNLTEEEITRWFELLDDEDAPLPLKTIDKFLKEAGFTLIEYKQMGMTAVFSAMRPLELSQVKAELLINGIRENNIINEIYKRQNPDKIPKTGNDGIFLTLNKNTEILVSFLHEKNQLSPYSLQKKEDDLYLTKHDKKLNIFVDENTFPDWYCTPINLQFFPSYFVLEDEHYLHLAYKCCAYNKEERCLFCSAKRRDVEIGECQDKSADDICAILERMLLENIIPNDYHFCLGGGTYLPLSENVDFFCKIITCIRKYRSKESGANPIWIEMIPPSKEEIQKLIAVGATSFGFNIEVFDDKLRHHFCPGKSKVASIGQYIEAFDIVNNSLGPNKTGSCIIVGLDNQAKLKNGIDTLVHHHVFPCVIPLKLFDGADMNLSEDVLSLLERDFISLSRYAADKVKENGIDVRQNEGCMRCPCCTIIHDLL